MIKASTTELPIDYMLSLIIDMFGLCISGPSPYLHYSPNFQPLGRQVWAYQPSPINFLPQQSLLIPTWDWLPISLTQSFRNLKRFFFYCKENRAAVGLLQPPTPVIRTVSCSSKQRSLLVFPTLLEATTPIACRVIPSQRTSIADPRSCVSFGTITLGTVHSYWEFPPIPSMSPY